ncbi:MAG: response regulator [Dehalococcoidia bacterium]
MSEASTTVRPIRVLLVDDEPVVRLGVRMLLGLEPDILVVGEAGNGAEALSLVPTLRPDVVLLDLMMPGLDGLSVAGMLRTFAPWVAVVILSLYDNCDVRARAEAAGISGFVGKFEAGIAMLPAIRRAAVQIHGQGMDDR